MEFVVQVLEQIFHKSPPQATRIMLTVHQQGSGIAGVYSKEIAETKKSFAIDLARESGFPLTLSTEPE
jgi:ATP-dependent Clp protease adaptor protein ClpS